MRCTMVYYIHSSQFSLILATETGQASLPRWPVAYGFPQRNIWFGARDRSGMAAWSSHLEFDLCASQVRLVAVHTLFIPINAFDR